MSEAYISELRLVAFNFAPKGWAMCNGQTLQIGTNQALFSLLGTTFGGDGRNTFLLPNLQGNAPMHIGNGHVLGERGGQYQHTITIPEMPAHTHPLMADNAAQNSNSPNNALLANTTGQLAVYGPATSLTPMSAAAITTVGGSQPHANQSPYLAMNWIICLIGIFPSRD